MGIVFRQSVKTTIVTFTGALLGALVIYLSTKLLLKTEFGFARNMLIQAVTISQIILLGVHSTLYIYLPRYADDDQRRSVLITIACMVPLVFTALFSLTWFLFKSWIITRYQIDDRVLIDRYFVWMPLYVLLWALITLLEVYLGSLIKIAVASFVKEVVLRLLNIGLIILYGYELISFNSFIIWSVLIHILPIVVLWLIARKTKGFYLSFNFKLFEKKEYKTLIDFTFFHSLINVTIVLLDNVNVLMLAPLDKKGVASVAVYATASFFISIFLIPYRAMATAAAPILNRAYEEGNKVKLRDLFMRAGVNVMSVNIGMGIIIACNLHNAIAIMPEGYAEIGSIVLILLLGRMIDLATGLNQEMMSISKYYRYSFYLTAFLVVCNIVLNRIFIPQYGIYGAAWSATIALAVYNIIKLWLLWHKMRLQPFSKGSLFVLIAGMPALAVGYYLPLLPNPYIDTIARTLAIALIYLLMIIWLKPSADISTYLQSIKTRKRLF